MRNQTGNLGALRPYNPDVSAEIEGRVETLESLMADVLRVSRETALKIDRLSAELDRRSREADLRIDRLSAELDRRSREADLRMDRLSAEMRAFKDEMRVFKFKDEMQAFREEARNERREMNKRWGDLAASLGTLVEDVVAPSVPRVLREVFGCPAEMIEFSGVRVKRKHPTEFDRNREFDTVAAGCGYFLTVESKVRLDIAVVNAFVESLPEVKEYFPEFTARGYRFAGAAAALYVDPSVIAFAEKRGLIVLGTAEDLMTVLNTPGFTPKFF